MNLSPLDNPVWHALNSHHQHLAIRTEGAARYQPNFVGAVAIPENTSIEYKHKV
jgi:hypothetical protein